MLADETEVDLETIGYLLQEHCNFEVFVDSSKDNSLIIVSGEQKIFLEISSQNKTIELNYMTLLTNHSETSEMRFLKMVNRANQEIRTVSSYLYISAHPNSEIYLSIYKDVSYAYGLVLEQFIESSLDFVKMLNVILKRHVAPAYKMIETDQALGSLLNR